MQQDQGKTLVFLGVKLSNCGLIPHARFIFKLHQLFQNYQFGTMK